MNVKRYAAVVASVLLAAGIAVPVVASAEVDGSSYQVQPRLTTPKQVRHPAEGGVWTYGNYGDFFIHSDYDHPTANHASSCALDGQKNSSICTAPGHPSLAKYPCPIDHPWTVDEYWYKLC